jgi:hypothetical protein
MRSCVRRRYRTQSIPGLQGSHQGHSDEHMAGHVHIIPPATLGEALRPLGDLAESEFSALMAALSGPRSFSLSKDELESLRTRVPTQTANLTFLLGALSYLYSQIARVVESGMPFDETVRATVDDLDKDADWGQKKDGVRDRLAAILQPKETHQRFRKIQRLQSGSIPNATGFVSFVDLRPDFGDGDELSLKGYIPVIQFRINTDSTEAKRLVFQRPIQQRSATGRVLALKKTSRGVR